MIQANKNIYLALLLLTFFCCFCQKREDDQLRRQVKEMLGKEVHLPPYRTAAGTDYTKAKLVTRINGNCMPCIYKLSLWKPFIQKLDREYKVPVLFYVTVSDTLLLKKVLSDIHFDYPIIIDYNDDFLKNNHLPDNSILHTMLLDSTNRISLLGTPLNNMRLQKLYFERIEELLNK